MMSDQSGTVDVPRTLIEGQRLDQPTFHQTGGPGQRQADSDSLYRSAVFPRIMARPQGPTQR